MNKKITTSLIGAAMAVALMAPVHAADKNIAVIIKATNSDFWQYVLVGANNYAKDHPGVSIKTYGPPAEADIDKQVAILEDVLLKKPDGIVIASTSSDATVPALEKAYAAKIPVVTIDNKVKTDKIVTHLATDNIKGGGLAAEQLVKSLQAAGKPLKGTVVVISDMAGVQVLVDRDEGFSKKLKELAPDIKQPKARYVNNDMMVTVNTAVDLIQSIPDLVGVFADNNVTGSGVAKVISETKKADTIMAVAFDSDPAEVTALKEGTLKGLVLQDPYGMGYNGVDTVIKAIGGEKFEPYKDTGATVVTKDNMDEAHSKELLDPMARKK
jgi:ribose transport system substrate-binding protein